ncbi:MAG: nucleoside/nucleotide kinase family protein [Motilibacteraceae bacterium]
MDLQDGVQRGASQPAASRVLDEAVARARSLAGAGERRLLGIAGLPGGGKSTVAQEVVRRLGPLACYVPMDGFHLANLELARLGRQDRKGAPDTFDVAGYVALLERLRAHGSEVVYAPAFDRAVDEAVAGAIPVPPEVPLVVTEGNYLLLDQGPWAQVAPLLDEAWFVTGDEDQRVEQLVRRHVAFGKDAEAARAWVLGSDQRNADVVAPTRDRADLVLELPHIPAWAGDVPPAERPRGERLAEEGVPTSN